MTIARGWRQKRRAKTLLSVLSALPVVICFKDNVLDVCVASGVSMQPTLNAYPDAETLRRYFLARYWASDVVLLDKMSIKFGIYEKESVVMLQSAEDPDRYLLKRLVGVEGDWIEDRDGNFRHVPKGQCWVEGDNSKDSIDSNSFGSVPLTLILGKAVAVLLPPWRMKTDFSRRNQRI